VQAESRRSRGGRARSRARAILRLSAAALLAVAAGACRGPAPHKEACLELSASPSLNLYDGQPHVVNVYIFPLSSSQGFRKANVEDLLDDARPPGVVRAPISITVAPGEEEIPFEDFFPPQTVQIGVVADYYREEGDIAGQRKLVVEARCGRKTPKLRLSAKDLTLDD